MENFVHRMRRKSLATKLGKHGIAFILGARAQTRNDDVEYPFRQSSNMLYLTNFSEPDALLVITGGKRGRSILFSRPKDETQETWTGKRLGQDGARKTLGVDEAYSCEAPEEVADIICALLSGCETVYFPTAPESNNGIIPLHSLIEAHRKTSPSRVLHLDVCALLAEFRLIKDEAEVGIMRSGIAISANMHRMLLEKVRPGMKESDLEAEIAYYLRKNGSDRLGAYPSIVAAGANACTLHYTENNCVIASGDLVLVDAGGEWDGYASDITRTFPANGVFSPPQRALYSIVLKAQKAAIAMISPGVSFYEVHKVAMLALCQGLLELGIIHAPNPRRAFEAELHKPYTIHSTSHWLGLDVHDAGDYQRNDKQLAMRKLEPGMVLTVEPGIYVTKKADVPDIYRSIGIRIEDDVLVTVDGNDVLSKEAPKEIDEIEDAMLGTRFF